MLRVYHRWLHTICGYKQYADDLDVQAWSKLCESIRKDAECVFGIMKKRFRILSCPFLDHEVSKLDATMKVCAILHNMWVRSSGLANIGSEAEHWKRVDNLEASNYGLDLSALGMHLVGRQGLWEEETLMSISVSKRLTVGVLSRLRIPASSQPRQPQFIRASGHVVAHMLLYLQ